MVAICLHPAGARAGAGAVAVAKIIQKANPLCEGQAGAWGVAVVPHESHEVSVAKMGV